LDSEYVIKGAKPWEAKIYSDDEEIAEIKKGDGPTFKLISKDGREWTLSNKVHEEMRPFSITVRQDQNKGKTDSTKDVLTIREHLFKYKDKVYMFTNHPEGRPWHQYLSSPVRYISRLDNFPYSDLVEIDHHLKHRLKRFRGVPVGEASGLGTHGHHVKVEKELEDIGLIIAASSYLLYSTG
jgi:hypothetical protein